GLLISAIGEVEALQPVVRRGEPDPGLDVAWRGLDRAAEMLLGVAVIAGAVLLLADVDVALGIGADQRVERRGRSGQRKGGDRRFLFLCRYRAGRDRIAGIGIDLDRFLAEDFRQLVRGRLAAREGREAGGQQQHAHYACTHRYATPAP